MSTRKGGGSPKRVAGKRIARIGEHPDGFHTCAYVPNALRSLADITVDEIELPRLCSNGRKKAIDDADGNHSSRSRRSNSPGAASTKSTRTELDRSLKLKVALDDLKVEGQLRRLRHSRAGRRPLPSMAARLRPGFDDGRARSALRLRGRCLSAR